MASGISFNRFKGSNKFNDLTDSRVVESKILKANRFERKLLWKMYLDAVAKRDAINKSLGNTLRDDKFGGKGN